LVSDIFGCTLYLLALINPVSKIFILSVFSKKFSPLQIRSISFRSSVIALLILLVFAFAGNIILTVVFHVQLYSFQIAAGVILFVMGFKALSKGIFYEIDSAARVPEVSVVPLASPMIAGPATITAVTTFAVQYPMAVVLISTTIAIAVNLGFMLISRWISKFLTRLHLMEALIRITGLIVATMAVQMVLNGAGNWFGALTK